MKKKHKQQNTTLKHRNFMEIRQVKDVVVTENLIPLDTLETIIQRNNLYF